MNVDVKATTIADSGFLRRCLQAIGLFSLVWITSPVQAVTIIPEKEGFGGYVSLGAGGIEIESNLLAKLARGIVDVGDAVIDSIDSSPDSDSAVVPMVNFELSYTFAESRTQLYVGNLLEDFLTFDLSARAGIRQDVKSAGIFSFAFLTTSLAADVWQDPYQAGVKRKDTERSGNGYRVGWERIFNSGLAVQYASKKNDIDNERSGQGLGLSPEERSLLNRNGDLNRLELGYEFSLADGRHILTPAVIYHDADIDGGAMARDGYGATLNYIYLQSDRWRWVFNLTYADFDYDKVNPVYGVRDDADNYGASVTVFYAEPFGWKPWSLNMTAGYFDEDHDIDFYDTSVAVFSVGLFRQF